MAAASSEIDAGRILQGRYTLLAKLGDHAGDVFTAQRASDGRVVVVRRWRAPAPQVANAFVERARAALVVRHPVLASVEACGQELDRTCFIVSEHVQGRRLDDWADKVGIPSFANVIEVGRKLCAGLLAAQQGGLTHDALHPRNVVVAQRSEGPAQPLQVKLLDLGVPAFVRPRVPHALAAQFMAPEQLAAVLGTASPTGVVADGAMNVYSLGCLLYYLCTGGAPFQCSTIDELREAHATGKLVPAVRINPKLPAQLDALIVRALVISPRERIQSLAELAEAFTMLDAGSGSGSGVRPVSVPAPSMDGDLSGLTFEETPTLTVSRPPRARTETPIIDVSEFAELLASATPERSSRAPEGPVISELPRAPSLPARTEPPAPIPGVRWRSLLLVAAACAGAVLMVLRPFWHARWTSEWRVPAASVQAPPAQQHPSPASRPTSVPAQRPGPALAPSAAPSAEPSTAAQPAEPVPPQAITSRDGLGARSEHTRNKLGHERERAPVVRDDKPVLALTPIAEPEPAAPSRADAAAVPAAPITPPAPELPSPYEEPATLQPAAAPTIPPAPAATVRLRATNVARDATARFVELEVRGSLPTALVRRAIERVRGQIATCYARVGQADSRAARVTLRVELEIDEAARARNVRVAGGPLSLDHCVADVASGIVSTRAPDTGTVKAAWKVVFEP